MMDEKTRFSQLIPFLRKQSTFSSYKSGNPHLGVHSGYLKGYEDELLQYHRYVQGDDLRFLDWKYLARSDRYYIREGYRYSRQKILIWIDGSVSLRKFPDKLTFSRLSALLLGWIFYKQGDQVHLACRLDGNTQLLKLRNKRDFIQTEEMLISGKYENGSYNPTAEEMKQLMITSLNKHNLIFWFTDMYLPLTEFREIIKTLKFRQHSLTLMHVYNQEEWNPKGHGIMTRFRDSETGEWLTADKLSGYRQIWEDSIRTRVQILQKSEYRYIRSDVSEGPLQCISKIN